MELFEAIRELSILKEAPQVENNLIQQVILNNHSLNINLLNK